MKKKIFFNLITAIVLTGCTTFNRPSSSNNSAENSSIIESASSSFITSEQTSSSFITSEQTSNSSLISVDFTTDPYAYIDTEEEREKFYSNYFPAVSYLDSYYRSRHFLMSGSISEQEYKPTIAEDIVTEGGKYVYNSSYCYSEDKLTYYLLDSKGNIKNSIYKGGAYVTLEEVCAYVLAFDDIPANYSKSKNTSVSSSNWGKYLRLNHSFFSDANAATGKYPYEPDLPDAYNTSNKSNGTKQYYEMDIGTAGNTESYVTNSREYNNGTNINRGTSRLVYTYAYKDGSKITNASEKYVFYTYNHYNDFQEFLNYSGGFGKRFGNMTGGGTYNNKTSQYRTEREEVIYREFRN